MAGEISVLLLVPGMGFLSARSGWSWLIMFYAGPKEYPRLFLLPGLPKAVPGRSAGFWLRMAGRYQLDGCDVTIRVGRATRSSLGYHLANEEGELNRDI